MISVICLALNIYFEARDQDFDGQRMIAEVTMERVHRSNFPNTVCDVVWQPGAFSWTSDGKSDKPKDMVAWAKAKGIAEDVILNGCSLCTGATYYHEAGITPYWAESMVPVGRWGDHIFYAEKGDDE